MKRCVVGIRPIEVPETTVSGKRAPTVWFPSMATLAAVLSEDNRALLRLIRQAIEEASDDQGWAFLGAVGSYLNKVRPDFDSRLYGHKKLSDLLRKHPRSFSVVERETQAGVKALFVKALAG